MRARLAALTRQRAAHAQTKDRTIDQLAAALEAREEALARHADSGAALQARSGMQRGLLCAAPRVRAERRAPRAQEVHERILQLQARTGEVEAEAERRAEAARRHKAARGDACGAAYALIDPAAADADGARCCPGRAQEARRLRGELAQAQAALSTHQAASAALERRCAAALAAQRAEADAAARRAEAALSAQRAAAEHAAQRAAAAFAAQAGAAEAALQRAAAAEAARYVRQPRARGLHGAERATARVLRSAQGRGGARCCGRARAAGGGDARALRAGAHPHAAGAGAAAGRLIAAQPSDERETRARSLQHDTAGSARLDADAAAAQRPRGACTVGHAA